MVVNIKKVLVCDAVHSACIDLLEKNGIQVDCKLQLNLEELKQQIVNYDGVIVRSDTKITQEVINSEPCKLKVIGRAGVGVDNIDTEAATKRNIVVLNSPTGNSISACELTCMLIGALARPIVSANHSMKEGAWNRKAFSGTELYNKTLAIIGLGRIGREVAVRMNAWNMKVIGYDPITTETEAKKAGVRKMELNEIWPLADYITVHTPLIPSTKHLISKDTLKLCKNGVKLINVARGGILDEEAVLYALKTGKCGGVALDVFSEEPPKTEVLTNLIQHPNVITTPHLGASTTEAQKRVAVEVAEQFIALTGTSEIFTQYPGIVNREMLHYFNL